MLQLKEIRLSQNKTQEETANYLKISRTAYTNIENGKRDPDSSTIEKLANFFEVSIDCLFGRKEPDSQFSTDEIELIDCFRFLNDAGQKILLHLSRMMRNDSQFSKNKSQNTAI